MSSERPLIAIVGPCAAGKSTLAVYLKNCGYLVRQPAQEHSYVPEMWQILTKPDFLIYLDVSYTISIQRTGNTWKESIFNQQIHRLKHAKDHADLYIQTDSLSPQNVQTQVMEALKSFGALPSDNYDAN